MSAMIVIRSVIRPSALALLTLLAVSPAAWGQSLTFDQLVERIFTAEDEDPYELTADFTGRLTLTVRGSSIAATATGTYEEVRKSGEPRRRKVKIERLDVPLLLRPFTGTLRRVIEEKVESGTENPETFHAHDLFPLQELPERYVVGGVHRSIVDDAISRFGRPQDKTDPATRRRIAHWLFTTPSRREFLIRPGPPYAMRAVVDDEGHVHDLTIFYDWGQITTKIIYIMVSDKPAWRHLTSDAISELSGLGRVEGELVLAFTNHCRNCRPKNR